MTLELSDIKAWTSAMFYQQNENRFVQCVMVFPSSFVYTGIFMSDTTSVLEKAEDVYPTDSPGPSSQFPFSIIMAILCSLLCVYVFPVWSLSQRYLFL